VNRVAGMVTLGIAALTLGVGCGTTSTAAPTKQAPAPAGPVVLDCRGQAARKPAEIVFFCADANELVKDVSWTAWEANAASGAGTLVHNTCKPTCVAGTWETTYVQLWVSAPEGDDQHFTQATVSFPDGHTENFQLPPPVR
jgi:hypothetical protein